MKTDEQAIDLVLSTADIRHVGCGGVVEYVPPTETQAACVRCQKCGRSLAFADLIKAGA